jgi:hypothetical protein
MELYRPRIDGRSTTGKEASLARKIDEIERRLSPAAANRRIPPNLSHSKLENLLAILP